MRIYKILTTLSGILIFLVVTIIAFTPPAAGYELTIYDAYPLYFWFLIIAAMACGIAIIIHQSLSKDKSYWWLAGLAIVIISNSIFLFLPYFRGYAFFPSGDAMTHVGMMKDIMVTGHIPDNDFYPIIHLLGIHLLFLTGLNGSTIVDLLIVIFSILFILNVTLLAKEIGHQRSQALLVIAFACPLIFSTFQAVIHPAILSIYMVPLLIYVYYKSIRKSSIETRIMVILVALCIIYFHPITCIFTILILVALNLSGTIYKRLFSNEISRSEQFLSYSFTIIPVILAFFLIWYLSFYSFTRDIRNVLDFFLYNANASPFDQQAGILSTAGMSVSQIFILFINKYGGLIIYAFISIIAVLYILIFRFNKGRHVSNTIFTFAILFIVSLGASAFSLFGFTGENEPPRIARFLLVISPVINGLLIGTLINRRRDFFGFHRSNIKRQALIGITAVSIICAAGIGVFNVYGSPLTVESNKQVTMTEIRAARWFSLSENPNIITSTTGVSLNRFDDLNFGVNLDKLPRATLDPILIPSNFGYDTNNTMAQTYNYHARYLITDEANRINYLLFPINVRPKAHNWGGQGYERLAEDQTVIHIYANTKVDVWLVSYAN